MSSTSTIQVRELPKISQTRKKFTLLELFVTMAIMGIMIAMAVMVWSNIRENAYDARTRSYQDGAEGAVRGYWAEVGQFEAGYEGITTRDLEVIDPGRPWVSIKASTIEGMNLENIPIEYFASTMIVEEDNMPADELVVASLSETGMVFYTRFKESTEIESSKLSFADFKLKESQSLQANLARGIDPE
jgi:hypothetical protein